MSIFFFDAQREKRRARSCLHCVSVPVLGFCGVADNVQGNKFKVIQIDITSKKVFRILRRNIPISQPMFTLTDVLSVNYLTHMAVRTSCCFSNSCFVIYIYTITVRRFHPPFVAQMFVVLNTIVIRIFGGYPPYLGVGWNRVGRYWATADLIIKV